MVTINGSWNNNGVACSKTSQCTSLGKDVLKHTFTASNGSPTTTASIWRRGTQPFMSLCEPQRLTLVSYYALSAGFELPQYVFDHDTQDFAKTSYELSFKVAMPPCFTQSDFVTGERIEPLVSTLYGDRKIGSSTGPGSISTGPPNGWFNGNGTAGGVCSNPAATVTPKCDGSATVHLSNGLEAPFAPVNFTWTLNGAPGAESPKAVAPNSSYSFTVIGSQFPVAVTGSNGFTKTFAWSWPEDCVQPTLRRRAGLQQPDPQGHQPELEVGERHRDLQRLLADEASAKGNSRTFTFAAGTGSATITSMGRRTGDRSRPRSRTG